MNFSPLSAFHDYRLRWNRVFEHQHPLAYEVKSDKEKRALEVLKIMEVIGSSQLNRLFIRDKKKVRQMEKRGLIKKHSLYRGNHEISLYTLGATGAIVVNGEEKLNQWFRFTEYMVLERILFFQLYQKLQDWYQDVHIAPAPERSPFVGKLIARGGDRVFYALVVRGNEQKIKYYLSKTIPKKPVICIVEHPVYLNELNPFLTKCNIRVTTDKDLKKEDFQRAFSMWHQGQWVREADVIENSKKMREAVNK